MQKAQTFLKFQQQNQSAIICSEKPLQKKKARGPPKGSKRKPNTDVGIVTGTWNISQMTLYLKFIIRFLKNFEDKQNRKKQKIFSRMSNFIKSRTSEQCRSHHQKLQIKFLSMNNIIDFIRSAIKELSGKQPKCLQKFIDHIPVKQNQKKAEALQQTNLNLMGWYEIKDCRGGLIISIDQSYIQQWTIFQ